MKPYSIYVHLTHKGMFRMWNYESYILPQKGDIFAANSFDNFTYQLEITERLLHTNDSLPNLITVRTKLSYPELYKEVILTENETV